MNLSRRSFLTAGLAAAGSLTLGACGSTTDDATTEEATTEEATYTLVTEGKLTSVAELGFAPFEYMDETTGEPLGFDIDLVAAIAEHMGLESEWLPNQSFDTLVPLIKQGGTADIACSGITINDARKEEVDFSDPYLDSNQSIVSLASAPLTETELDSADMTVACQAGTTGDEWIDENLPNATKVSLADVTAAMMGVSTGLYNAFVIDLPVSQNLIANSFSDLAVSQEIPTGEQYGIAVSKDNPNLTAAINEALAAMDDDGTMTELKTKWFGTEI